MTAKEAREISSEVWDESLKEIFILIEQAASKGNMEVEADRKLTVGEIRRLKILGYDCYTVNNTVIEW